MKEVIKRRPKLNTDDLRNFNYGSFEDSREYIAYRWPEAGEISPQTYPRIADLCAGDGSIAGLFCDDGWDPRNVLCVDRYKSPDPIVEGVTWAYWDLEELGRRLLFAKLGTTLSIHGLKLHEGLIPPEVSKYKGFFDIVVQEAGGIPLELREVVCEYFVRPGGLIYHTNGETND